MRSFSLRFAVSFCLLLSFVMATLAQSKAFDPSRMDTSADACENFFQFWATIIKRFCGKFLIVLLKRSRRKAPTIK